MSQHMLKHHIGEVSEVIDSKESQQSVVHSMSPCSALLPEPAAAPSQRATSLDNQLGDYMADWHGQCAQGLVGFLAIILVFIIYTVYYNYNWLYIYIL